MIHDNYESVRAAQNMFKALEQQENAQLSMQLTDIDSAYVRFSIYRTGFLGWLGKAKQSGQSEREKNVLEKISQNYSQVQSAFRFALSFAANKRTNKGRIKFKIKCDSPCMQIR